MHFGLSCIEIFSILFVSIATLFTIVLCSLLVEYIIVLVKHFEFGAYFFVVEFLRDLMLFKVILR